MPFLHYDTIIVGAGPAGCAAALRLRQQGLRVAMIDAVKEDKRKVGESLPGASIRLLRGLGINDLFELLNKYSYEACTANRSAWGSEQWTYTDALRNPEGGGWHVVRHEFDAALRRKAIAEGVDFLCGKVGNIASGELHTLTFRTQKANLPEAIHTPWLIDATGRAAAVTRQFGVERIKFQPQMAAVCWLHPNLQDQDRTTTIKSVANGWWYTSRLPDGSRVLSFHGLPETVASFVKDPKSYLQEANNAHLINYNLHTSHFLEDIKARDASVSKASRVFGSNWIAVGDAALSFDPLSSQGIFFALYSGLKAADAHIKIKTGDTTALEQYEQKVQNVFEANQRSRAHFYTAERRFINEDYWNWIPQPKLGDKIKIPF
ncbi:NAD(P)/FAD-dependent oxidoreductase [Flavobacteriaceae bacterium M23B6Z8]